MACVMTSVFPVIGLTAVSLRRSAFQAARDPGGGVRVPCYVDGGR